MSSVVHFIPEAAENTACGAKVFLCEEYSERPGDVDCKRCKATKVFKNYDPTRFNVDVWNNFSGDVVRWFKRVTAAEVEDIRSEFADEPMLEVVVEEA